MSFESNEERIELLEKKVSDLTTIMLDTIRMFPPSQQTMKCLLEMSLHLSDQQNAIIRFIGSNPLFGTPEERKELLALVARGETANDRLMARVRDLNNSPDPSDKREDQPPV